MSNIIEANTVPKQKRFFYGWVIVFVMAVASAVGMGMGSLNFGLYIKPMGDELGIGRASFGWASTVRSISSAATSPLIGSLLDRYGARWLLAGSIVITGLSMIGLSYVIYPWHLMIAFAVMGLVGMSGPGALITSVPPTKWFIRDRGKALAFTSVGISIGAMIFVPLTQVFIDKFTWQGAWIILGVFGMVVVVPLSVLLLRRQPEDMGLLPDGDLELSNENEIFEEYSWTVTEAVKTPSMWLLTGAFSILHLGIFTFALHRIPAFMDRGLDPGLVSLATAFDAVCAGIGSFGGGILVRNISSKYIGASAFLMLAGASVLTIFAHDFWLMFWSMALFGLGIGVNSFTQNYIWAEYFGRGHLGSIRGLVMPISLVVGGIGAPAAGYVRDITGSYDLAWWSGVALMLLAAGMFITANNPNKLMKHIDKRIS